MMQGVLGLFDTIGLLIVAAALFSYASYRIRIPPTIGLMAGGLAAGAALVMLDLAMPQLGIGVHLRTLNERIGFADFLLHGVLGFLLFAGSLHIESSALRASRGPILTLASVGVIVSTAIIGTVSYYVFAAAHSPLPFSYCLVFGALISPTDPIAVLSVMRTLPAPRALATKIAGESLLNDGVGVVLFTVLLAAAQTVITPGFIILLAVKQVAGGVAIGFIASSLVVRMLRRIDDLHVEVFLSFALVAVINLCAGRAGVSGPLACVVAGLVIGNRGRMHAMSDTSRNALDVVWSFVDYVLNAILFLLLGLQATALPLHWTHLSMMLAIIVLALLARLVSVAIPLHLLHLRTQFSRGSTVILTWGGLRGGLSVAMALSLPPFQGRETVLAATYAVAVFSIIVQGLTVGPLIRRFVPRDTL